MRSTAPPDDGRADQLALALGWLHLGLRLLRLLAPRTVARLTGVPGEPLLVRLPGLRDISCRLGLMEGTPAPPTPAGTRDGQDTQTIRKHSGKVR